MLVGWDSLETPTYRHEAFESYQSGRVFEEPLLEQLALLPAVCEKLGFVVAKAPGYEADDFLAAAAQAWPGHGARRNVGPRRVPARQRPRHVLRPRRASSEIARIDPDEVRDRYGVDPEQVPDLIALRGDPSDKLPGARGIGPKKAAEILGEYRTLEDVLAAGRFASEAEDLRLFRRIAQMDASAPLPPLKDQTPHWAEASSYLPEARARRRRRATSLRRVNKWLAERADALADATGIDRDALELSTRGDRRAARARRLAAHSSGARTNAPLLCYLLGRARPGVASLAELDQIVRSTS